MDECMSEWMGVLMHGYNKWVGECMSGRNSGVDRLAVRWVVRWVGA